LWLVKVFIVPNVNIWIEGFVVDADVERVTSMMPERRLGAEARATTSRRWMSCAFGRAPSPRSGAG
jgi:hypothetical protein